MLLLLSLFLLVSLGILHTHFVSHHGNSCLLDALVATDPNFDFEFNETQVLVSFVRYTVMRRCRHRLGVHLRDGFSSATSDGIP